MKAICARISKSVADAIHENSFQLHPPSISKALNKCGNVNQKISGSHFDERLFETI